MPKRNTLITTCYLSALKVALNIHIKISHINNITDDVVMSLLVQLSSNKVNIPKKSRKISQINLLEKETEKEIDNLNRSKTMSELPS